MSHQIEVVVKFGTDRLVSKLEAVFILQRFLNETFSNVEISKVSIDKLIITVDGDVVD